MIKFDYFPYIIMEQKGFDIEKEIQRIEALYKHYKSLYRKMAFLCCSEETKRVRKQKKSYKNELKTLKRMKASAEGLH